MQVYRVDELPRTLDAGDELHLPDILGDLRVGKRRPCISKRAVAIGIGRRRGATALPCG